MPMNPRLLRPIASRFLLDQYGDAAAAYSLRRLRTGYTGAAVRVRRSNDNAEADFTPEQIANGDLTAWTGANNGFVRTWYDQSGNARNAGQSTTTLQPQIVTSGALFTLNGKPAIDWPGASANRVLTSTISTTSAISTLAVFSAARRAAGYVKLFNLGADATTSGYALTPITGLSQFDWTDTNTGFLCKGFNSGEAPRIVTTGTPVASSVTTQHMLFATAGSATSRMFVNRAEVTYGVQLTGNASTLTNAVLYLCNNELSQQLIGRTQEIIIWTSDIFASRLGIERNTAAFYGVP